MLICQFGEDDWTATHLEWGSDLAVSITTTAAAFSFLSLWGLERPSELKGEALPFLPALGFQETKDGTEHKASLGHLGTATLMISKTDAH